MVDVNRRWLLKTRPAGMLKDEDLDFIEEPVPEPAEGEILVRVQMLSCDPAQRGWLERDTYVGIVNLTPSTTVSGANSHPGSLLCSMRLLHEAGLSD